MLEIKLQHSNKLEPIVMMRSAYFSCSPFAVICNVALILLQGLMHRLAYRGFESALQEDFGGHLEEIGIRGIQPENGYQGMPSLLALSFDPQKGIRDPIGAL